MEGIGGKVRRTEAEWREIVEAAERSGMTRSRYCRAQGIDYEQFLYHRRKLLTKGTRVQAMARSRGGALARGLAHRAFIPIEVSGCGPSTSSGRSPSAGSGCYGVRLEFPCGFAMASDELPPAAWLVEVAARWAGAGMAPC